MIILSNLTPTIEKNSNHLHFVLFLVCFFVFSHHFLSANAEINFEEVTEFSEISYKGSSWGASWGDYNGDGWADLFTSNHGQIPHLYMNNGNGTFTNISSFHEFEKFLGKDTHGAAWADFDNDGDQDLIVLTGAQRGIGSGPNLFFLNKEGKLEDQASSYGLDYPLGRGRTPLWFDYNNDGMLDVILGNFPRPDNQTNTALFVQTLNGFADVTSSSGLNFKSHVSSIQLSDFSLNGRMDLVAMKPSPEGIFEKNQNQFVNIRENLKIPSLRSADLTIADFNGDLLPDIFFNRVLVDKSSVDHVDENQIRAHMVVEGKQSFSFKTNGSVNFDFYPILPMKNEILIGSKGMPMNTNNFTLIPNDPDVIGPYNLDPNKEHGILIHLDKNNWWTVSQISKTKSYSNIIIKTSFPILETNFNQLDSSKLFLDDKLYFHNGKSFDNKTQDSGLLNPSSCRSVVSADFDNDMDIDIYQVCSTYSRNIPNILYENQGTGVFFTIENFGAEASLDGIGDSVTTVDFDNDGFIDLFVTNGFESKPFSNNGPSQLFKNLGNNNNWLELDLKGTLSNRDGIGSKIIISTNNIKQIREQNGGMHHGSQNYQRIHFGLGNHSIAESILIFWPSGIIQEIKDTNSNQILKIVEPSIPLPPNHQLKLGLKNSDILCKANLVKLIKITDQSVICVKKETQSKLIERGWQFKN